MQKTLIVIASLVALFFIIGFTLSPEFDFEKSIIIKSSPDKIHPYVNDLKLWTKWSPWQEIEPGKVITYGNVTKGIGASQTWKGPTSNGRLYITVSSPSNGIAYDEFLGNNKNPYICAIEYKLLESGSTKVTWRIHGEVEMSMLGGYTALIVKSMFSDMYKKGLLKLKWIVENKTE